MYKIPQECELYVSVKNDMVGYTVTPWWYFTQKVHASQQYAGEKQSPMCVKTPALQIRPCKVSKQQLADHLGNHYVSTQTRGIIS